MYELITVETLNFRDKCSSVSQAKHKLQLEVGSQREFDYASGGKPTQGTLERSCSMTCLSWVHCQWSITQTSKSLETQGPES